MYTLNCRGKLLSLETPVVMGIINATSDSFYEHDLETSIDMLLGKVAGMINDGAAIIDVGGQSTRPGSDRLTAEIELSHVLPVITAIHQRFPNTIISVDTYFSLVAELAVSAGAGMVNDISAGEMDEGMIPTVARLGVPYVCMHMKGRPESMQQNPVYEDVVKEVLDFFIAKADQCRKAGIKDLIIDPGFGFGKNTAHNFALLKNMEVIKMLEVPVLAGVSRKGMVYKTLASNVEAALNGTTVLNTIALMNGADILRVHDVKEAMEAIKLVVTLEQS
ncbi:MAG: Dihydropteroate synthase [Ferruginibacter sp.]|nr:Dihydropteroate synthase [Ferruginibacter sp.]